MNDDETQRQPGEERHPVEGIPRQRAEGIPRQRELGIPRQRAVGLPGQPVIGPASPSPNGEGRIDLGTISFKCDEDGYLGRECPREECLGYFKVRPGTGLQNIDHCHCPYCGHKDSNKRFWTRDQIDFMRSTAMSRIMPIVREMTREAFAPLNRQRHDLISITATVKDEPLPPIHQYREKKLETSVICQCGLDFAVYGVFGYCPDCGRHNSHAILERNLHLAGKILDLARNQDGEVRERLVGTSLESCVAAFDGFGRELFRIWPELPLGDNPSFQNIVTAKERISKAIGLDISAKMPEDDWDLLVISFQKRHLLAHKMGVVDEEYLRKTGDASAVCGRKVTIAAADVERLIRLLGDVAGQLLSVLPKRPDA